MRNSKTTVHMFNGVTRREAVRLLDMMFYIRTVEERIAREYKNGYMKCPVHLYIGQEAIAAGVCLNLSKEDFIVTNHRSHGHYLAKGGALLALLEELSGFSSGCAGGWGGSQHVFAPQVGILGTSAIVGGGIAVGTGIAWALKMNKERRLCAVFFGDGASEEGYFYESLNFASLKKLPVLYVCENNFLATYSRIEKRRPAGVQIYKIAQSLAIPSFKVDGTDSVKLYRVIKDMVKKMRASPQPFMLEATTYRWRGHVSMEEDCGKGYRTREEIEKWKRCCSITRLMNDMHAYSLLSPKTITKIQADVIARVDTIFRVFKKNSARLKAKAIPATPY